MADKKNQEGTTPLDEIVDSSDNLVNDYSELIETEVFIGDIPYPTIIENIKTQFDDYVNIQDETNYVDIFYEQLHASYLAITESEDVNQDDMVQALDRIRDDFIDTMKEQFTSRLTITIMALESEEYDLEEIEYDIRQLYDYFILGARKNFIQVITTDVLRQVGNRITDDRVWFQKMDIMMRNYSPLFCTMTPDDFLKYSNTAEQIIELYNTGKIGGNFLRKYSPKFYRNEEFQVEVVNEVTMMYAFQNDLKKEMNGEEPPKEDI